MALPTPEQIEEDLGKIAVRYGVVIQKRDPILLSLIALYLGDERRATQQKDMLRTAVRDVTTQMETSAKRVSDAAAELEASAPKYGAFIRTEVEQMKKEAAAIERESLKRVIDEVSDDYKQVISDVKKTAFRYFMIITGISITNLALFLYLVMR